jgi:hypothetical protein
VVPTSVVEPLKIIAVTVVGKGHWITGTAKIVGSLCLCRQALAGRAAVQSGQSESLRSTSVKQERR